MERRAAKVSILQLQAKPLLLLKVNLSIATTTDYVHHGLQVFTKHEECDVRVDPASDQFSPVRSTLGRVAGECAEQTHDPDVVLIGLFHGEVTQSVDAADAHRQNVAAEHLSSLLVSFVQQALLSDSSLTLR